MTLRKQERGERIQRGHSNGKRDSHGSTVPAGGAVWIVALLFLLSASAGFDTVFGAGPTVNSAGAPEMYARCGDRLEPLSMIDLQVDLEIAGIVTYGRVVQTFENPFPNPVEAVYVFPLPERAAVHDMEMRIGERRIRSQVREREEARRVYEDAREQGKKASLVEEDRPNLFTTSVANIGPGEVVRVELAYVDEVLREGSTFSICFPLTFTPRYIPGTVGVSLDDAGAPHPVSSRVTDADRITPPFARPGDEAQNLARESLAVRAANDGPSRPAVRLDVWLQPGIPVTDVKSVTHDVEIVDASTESLSWRVRPSGTIEPDRDFRLEWEADTSTGTRGSVLLGEHDGESFVLAMIVPPERDAAGATRLATETLFVIDVSGSMAGPSIRQAREALAAALERLDGRDSFNILCFNETSQLYARQFVVATPDNVARAARWVRRLDANGGTEILPALVRGLDLLEGSRAGHEERQQRMVFLTDGAVGNETEVLAMVESRLHGRRLHTLGIGPAPNRYLLREMAVAGRGLCDFVSTDEEAVNSIDAFLRRISHPVWTNLQLDWVGLDVEDMLPSTLPDLHLGEPILVSARVRANVAAPGSKQSTGASPRLQNTFVVLRDAESSRVLASLPVERAREENPAIGVRWGSAYVDALLAQWRHNGQDAPTRAEVIAVATRFGMVTPFTSRVAVEEIQTVDAVGTPRWVPAALPHGSQLMGSLPRGGTLRPFWRLIGILCMSIGLAGPLLTRVRVACDERHDRRRGRGFGGNR